MIGIIVFMGKRKTVCLKFRCGNQPFMGGLCKQHFEEDKAKEARRDTALKALSNGLVDKELVKPGPLRQEFERVQKWWNETCDALNSSRQHKVLLDDTEYAASWCIGLAEEIIDAVREERAGKESNTEIRKYMRQRTWDRFENLEKGLMSNGVARPKRAKTNV
jgi:hypothetical protein